MKGSKTESAILLMAAFIVLVRTFNYLPERRTMWSASLLGSSRSLSKASRRYKQTN